MRGAGGDTDRKAANIIIRAHLGICVVLLLVVGVLVIKGKVSVDAAVQHVDKHVESMAAAPAAPAASAVVTLTLTRP